MTVAEFQTYIRQYFKRTDKNTEILQAHNDMIVWVAVHMPHGGYKYQSWMHTVVGQEDYPLPSTLMQLFHPIRLLLGSASTDSGFPLDHLTKEAYDLREPNPNRTGPSTGRPSAYTVYSHSILVTPLADSTDYLLEINWGRRPTALTTSSDTPTLGAEWDQVLKCGALERLYAGLGLYQEAQYWAGQYRDAEGNPIGMCRTLFDLERDREGVSVGQVVFNDL